MNYSNGMLIRIRMTWDWPCILKVFKSLVILTEWNVGVGIPTSATSIAGDFGTPRYCDCVRFSYDQQRFSMRYMMSFLLLLFSLARDNAGWWWIAIGPHHDKAAFSSYWHWRVWLMNIILRQRHHDFLHTRFVLAACSVPACRHCFGVRLALMII